MKDRTIVLSNGTSFGTWLSELRKSKGLTTQALASKIGVDDGNLSRVENDRIQPTLLTVVAICNGLGITWQQLYAALSRVGVSEASLETLTQFDTNVTGDPDPQALQVSDVQLWLALWYRDAQCAEQLLARLHAEAQACVASRSGNPVASTAFLQPSAIFRLSQVHHFEITYPPAGVEYRLFRKLQIAYDCRALFILEDIDFYILMLRLEQIVLTEEQIVFIEAKLRTGISEKLKFVDAVSLDQVLGTDGMLIGMFWLAIQTRNSLEHLIKKSDQGAEQTRMLILSLIRLCRWKQSCIEDDFEWLSELRQELAIQD